MFNPINLFNLFSVFGGQNGFSQRLQAFSQQFGAQNNCTPEQKVQQMLGSRQMTQEQFEMYANIATQITGRRPF